MSTRTKIKTRVQRPAVRELRDEFGLTQAVMARLLDVSLRTVVSLERSTVPASPRTVVETRRLLDALSEVIRPEYLKVWLEEPADEFGGMKPIEVIERGETDRIWEMIYRLGSGEPT